MFILYKKTLYKLLILKFIVSSIARVPTKCRYSIILYSLLREYRNKYLCYSASLLIVVIMLSIINIFLPENRYIDLSIIGIKFWLIWNIGYNIYLLHSNNLLDTSYEYGGIDSTKLTSYSVARFNLCVTLFKIENYNYSKCANNLKVIKDLKTLHVQVHNAQYLAVLKDLELYYDFLFRKQINLIKDSE